MNELIPKYNSSKICRKEEGNEKLLKDFGRKYLSTKTSRKFGHNFEDHVRINRI